MLVARTGSYLSLYMHPGANYGPLMTSSFSHLPVIRRLLAAASLALVLVVAMHVGPARAAFPGVPGPIAYAEQTFNEGLSGGLFTHGPRLRQGSHQLTNDPEDSLPAYSPNGRTIAFAGNRDPRPSADSHIYLMNADGSGIGPLTSGDNHDSNPSFSPNGRQVVFDRAIDSSRASHIFIVNVDGSGLRQLTDGAGSDSEPVFAPSGNWIAFVSNRDPDERGDRSDIFSMRPDGSRQRMLIDGPRNESEPDISPNGRKIAFSSNRRAATNIFVAQANGRRVRALTHAKERCFLSGCYYSPSWAPDGKHIALLRSGRYVSSVQVMRSNGSQRKTFASTSIEPEGFGSVLGAPAWGPRRR